MCDVFLIYAFIQTTESYLCSWKTGVIPWQLVGVVTWTYIAFAAKKTDASVFLMRTVSQDEVPDSVMMFRALTCIDLTSNLFHELISNWVISWQSCYLLYSVSRHLLEGAVSIRYVVTCCWTDLSKELIEVRDVGSSHHWAVAEASFAVSTTILFTTALSLGWGRLWAVKCAFACQVLRAVIIKARHILSSNILK